MRKTRLIFALLASAISISTVTTMVGCSNSHDTTKYKVTFDTDGGSAVSKQEVKKNWYIKTPKTPKKEGYVFDKWTYNNKEWNFTKDKVTSDMRLKAKYQLIDYKITYYLVNAPVNHPEYDFVTSYNVESDITLPSVNSGDANITFSHYQDLNGKNVTGISKGTTGDLFLRAIFYKWTGNISLHTEHCNYALDCNGYLGTTCTLKVIPDEGYEFKGIYKRGTDQLVSSTNQYIFVLTLEDIKLDLICVEEMFSIPYALYGSRNESNPTEVSYEDEITLQPAYKPGFKFLRWIHSDDPNRQVLVVGGYELFTRNILNEDWTLVPVFANDNVQFKTTSNYDSLSPDYCGKYYTVARGTTLFIDADIKTTNQIFIGWYYKGKLLSRRNKYKITIYEDMNVEARYSIDNDYAYYSPYDSEHHNSNYSYHSSDGTSINETYNYYDDGRVSSYSYDHWNSANNYSFNYYYDDTKREVKSFYFTNESIFCIYYTVETFDSYSNLISYKKFLVDGTLVEQATYINICSSDGTLSKVINDETKDYKVYKYRDGGLTDVVVESSYKSDNSLEKTLVKYFTYDSYDRLVKYGEYESDNKFKEDTYTYDSKGRVCYETHKNSNQPNNISEVYYYFLASDGSIAFESRYDVDTTNENNTTGYNVYYFSDLSINHYTCLHLE